MADEAVPNIQRRRKVSGLVMKDGGQAIVDLPVEQALEALNSELVDQNEFFILDGPQGDKIGVRASNVNFVIELEVAPAVPGLQTQEPVIAGPEALRNLPGMPRG